MINRLIPNMGGVLRNLSIFKAFSDFASLRKGGVAVC